MRLLKFKYAKILFLKEIKFQALVRKFLASRYVQNLKLSKSREQEMQIRLDCAATKLQVIIFSLKKINLKYPCKFKNILKINFKKKNLQALVRGFLARCAVQKLRKHEEFEIINDEKWGPILETAEEFQKFQDAVFQVNSVFCGNYLSRMLTRQFAKKNCRF